MSDHIHHLSIRCPDGLPLTEVLLDGEPLKMVKTLKLSVGPDGMVEAVLEMFVAFDIEADLEISERLTLKTLRLLPSDPKPETMT